MVARLRGVEFETSRGGFLFPAPGREEEAWDSVCDVATWLGFQSALGGTTDTVSYRHALEAEKSAIFHRATRRRGKGR